MPSALSTGVSYRELSTHLPILPPQAPPPGLMVPSPGVLLPGPLTASSLCPHSSSLDAAWLSLAHQVSFAQESKRAKGTLFTESEQMASSQPPRRTGGRPPARPRWVSLEQMLFCDLQSLVLLSHPPLEQSSGAVMESELSRGQGCRSLPLSSFLAL